MDLNNFGKNLQFNRRGDPSKLTENLSDKEAFIQIIERLDKCWTDSNDLYDKFKISILEYEEGYYQVVEDLLTIHYGSWKTELILWYIFGRFDEDENLYPLIIQTKGKEDEKVFLKTPLQLWNLLDRLEKQKRKDEESENK
jgi:hypothetical protein|tara:strand:+ start:1997 stop:2419 length:423 start_codon:yes stop_codon:yes gene_type:complete